MGTYKVTATNYTPVTYVVTADSEEEAVSMVREGVFDDVCEYDLLTEQSVFNVRKVTEEERLL